MKKFLSYCLVVSFVIFQAFSAGFSPEDTLETARSLIKQYPEVSWLLDEKVEHSQQGDPQIPTSSFSLQIMGSHYPEFERTAVSVLTLYALNDGSEAAYQWLTTPQGADVKLTFPHFESLHKFAQAVVARYGMKACETSLIIGDLGKTPIAHELSKARGIQEGDHDRWLAECLRECPDIFPSFEPLPPEAKGVIQSQIGLVHLGHLRHVEGESSRILGPLKRSGILKKGDELDFLLLETICDTAAARAQVNNRGSIILNEKIYLTMMATLDAIHFLSTHATHDTLMHFMDHWKEWLSPEGNPDPVFGNYALLRIAANMRFTTPGEGSVLKKAWTRLDPGTKDVINKQFSPLLPHEGQTPTYVPAVLTNMYEALLKEGLSPEEALFRVLNEGLPFILRIISDFRSSSSFDPNLTLNFNRVGGKVRTHPHIFALDPIYHIDDNGNVDLLSS